MMAIRFRLSGLMRSTRGCEVRAIVKSKLTSAAAAVLAMIREGQRLDDIAPKVGAARRTLLRWVARDPAFREGYIAARRHAHAALYDELRQAIAAAARQRQKAAYAARKRIMTRAPKKYGRLPKEERPEVLGELDRPLAKARHLFRTLAWVAATAQ